MFTENQKNIFCFFLESRVRKYIFCFFFFRKKLSLLIDFFVTITMITSFDVISKVIISAEGMINRMSYDLMFEVDLSQSDLI
jgi:hypothetical protein